MDEALQNDIKKFRQIQWQKLLRTDRGDYHLKEIKPHLDFIKQFLTYIIDSPHLENNYTAALSDQLEEFEGIQNRILAYEQDSQKQEIINQVISYKTSIFQSLKGLSDILKQEEEYRLGLHPDHDEEYSGKYYAKLTKEFRQSIAQIEQKQNQIQSQLEERTVRDEASRYGDFFKKEAEENDKKSWRFRRGVWLISFTACLFAYCAFPFSKDLEEVNNFVDWIVIGNILGKVFILSIMIFLITLLRKEYLALRHQATLDKHRHNALASHKEILNSIQQTTNESDREISNAILLELTRAMFNPQDTGFLKDQKNTSSESKIVEVSKSVLNTPQG